MIDSLTSALNAGSAALDVLFWVLLVPTVLAMTCMGGILLWAFVEILS